MIPSRPSDLPRRRRLRSLLRPLVCLVPAKRRIRELVVGIAAVFPAIAAADPLPGLDLRSFRPSTDPRGQLVVEPVRGGDRGEMAFFAYSDVSYRPISLFSQSGGATLRPMNVQLIGHLGASLGVGTRSQVGVVMPFAFALGGDGLPRDIASEGRTPRSALGDLALTWKSTLRDNTAGGFGLAILGDLSLPTGSKDAFVGEKGPTVAIRALAEYNLLLGGLQAQLGYGVRTAPVTWPASYGPTYGDWVPYRVGAWFSPKILGVDPGNRQRWELGIRGYVPAGPVAPFGLGRDGAHALSSLVLAASNRIALDPRGDVAILAGAEFGLVQGAGTPAARAVFGLVYAPQETDADHDGVDDDKDLCKDIPEDRDGFEDDDGCPDIDDDEDGIPDTEDACPRDKGVHSDDPKTNGCGGKDSDGDGIPDRLDACPFSAGPSDGDPGCNGCADDVDTDRDGIYDDDDRFKTEPEDKDGFEDDDGCPDPDNDHDGILDGKDACPNVAGRASEDPSKNGCLPLDKDGDTVPDASDKCPTTPANWLRTKSDAAPAAIDGCPVATGPKDAAKPRAVLGKGGEITANVLLDSPKKPAKTVADFEARAAEAIAGEERDLRAVATLANSSGLHLTIEITTPKTLPEAGRIVERLLRGSLRDGERTGFDSWLLLPASYVHKSGAIRVRFLLEPAKTPARPEGTRKP